MAPLKYHHVDVFADRAYAGNSLAVIVDPPELAPQQMLQITQELHHFETIFTWPMRSGSKIRARVFDLGEELDFAGHPVLGAAAVLHGESGTPVGKEVGWTFILTARTVQVRTREREDGTFSARLDAGRPEILRQVTPSDRAAAAAALGLAPADLDERFAPEVISAGLRYLLVPVRDTTVLARARIADQHFERFLAGLGAQFVYVLDLDALEGRHWNNDGLVEDVATGSAAACVAAYLLRHGRAGDGEELSLKQGRFTGRPSQIIIAAHGTADAVAGVMVGGHVATVGVGQLLALPSRDH